MTRPQCEAVAPDPGAYLWSRFRPRGRWVRVGAYRTRAEAFDAMHGPADFLVMETDRDPNTRTTTQDHHR